MVEGKLLIPTTETEAEDMIFCICSDNSKLHDKM